MASIEQLKGSDGSGNANVATIQNIRSPGASTIIVDTVLGINPDGFSGSMGTPHTFTDPITSEVITVISEATAVDFTGHVDGGNLEIDDIAPGYTDAGSEVGDIVIIRPTTQWSDNLAETLEASHDDDGSLKDGAVDAAGVLGANVVTTAKILNGNVTNDKLAPGIIIPASYVSVATGQSSNSATYVDVAGITTTFTTPMACTAILLVCEFTASADTGGTNYYLALTDSSNNIKIERSYAQSDNNVSHIGTMRLSVRITGLTANTSYTYKLRHHTTGTFTGVVNQGNNANSPTILYAMVA